MKITKTIYGTALLCAQAVLCNPTLAQSATNRPARSAPPTRDQHMLG